MEVTIREQNIARKAVLALLVLLLVMVHLLTLARYPAPFVDEGWVAARAWAFRDTHRVFGPLDHGVFDRFPGYWTYFPWLPTVLQSLAYLHAHAPSLPPLRAVSLIFGGALLFALFVIARRAGGTAAAWLTVLLVGLSRSFVYSAHLVRWDVLVAALGFGAIALVFRKTTSGWWQHLLAGLAVSLAFEAHPYGSLFIPAVLLVYFAENRLAAFRAAQFWWCCAGIAAGLAFYALLHVLPYPATWIAINRLIGSATRVPPIATLDPAVLAASARKFWSLAFYASPYLLPVAIGGFVVLLIDRRDRALALVMLSVPVLFVLLVQHKLFYYAILFMPALELAAAVFCVRAFSGTWRLPWMQQAARIAAVILLACGILYSLLPLRYDWSRDFTATGNQLRKIIRPGESVMGSQTWWFALYKQPWLSWENLHYYRAYKPGASIRDAFMELRPDVLIIDGHLSSFISEAGAPPDSYADQLRLPPSDMNALISSYGRVRAQFEGGYFGNITVIEFPASRRAAAAQSANRSLSW